MVDDIYEDDVPSEDLSSTHRTIMNTHDAEAIEKQLKELCEKEKKDEKNLDVRIKNLKKVIKKKRKSIKRKLATRKVPKNKK